MSQPQQPAAPTTEGQWFAIQTLSNKEASVKRYIEHFRAVEEMEEHLFEVLMPEETVTEIKNGKKTTKKRKFYPNYIFLRMKLYDEDGRVMQKPWYFINGIDGVIGFIGKQNPVALKESEIQTIIAKMHEAEGRETPKVQFNVGEEVRITDGPFLNFNGRVDEIDGEAGKLKVSVSIFGRFTPVTLEFWQVERISE